METPPPENQQHQQEDLLNEVIDTGEYDKKIKDAQNALLIVSGINLISGIVQILTDNSEAWLFALGIFVVIAGLFAALAFWAKYKPFAALLIGLILYIGIFILFAVLDPSSIIRGIIFKAIVVIYLIKGLIAANDAQQIKNLAK